VARFFQKKVSPSSFHMRHLSRASLPKKKANVKIMQKIVEGGAARRASLSPRAGHFLISREL
jgi:hypothetical protein